MDVFELKVAILFRFHRGSIPTFMFSEQGMVQFLLGFVGWNNLVEGCEIIHTITVIWGLST